MRGITVFFLLQFFHHFLMFFIALLDRAIERAILSHRGEILGRNHFTTFFNKAGGGGGMGDGRGDGGFRRGIGHWFRAFLLK